MSARAPAKGNTIRNKRSRNDQPADDASPATGEPNGRHLPVMLHEVLASLAPRDGGIYLDGTFGGGGYTRAILEQASCTVWAIDRDPDAIARGRELAGATGQAGRAGASSLQLIEGGFGDMVALLAARGVSQLDGVVLDLGVSSFQIDQAERGFSFRHDGPLDMRMSRQGQSAADLVRTLGEAELADIIYQYGEERLSRRIARAIVAARQAQPIETTLQLATIIRGVMPPDRTGRIDPATRSFQALRIHVNDELGEIRRGLEAAAFLLAPGGRLVVVSFHSLEDRIIKHFMTGAAGRLPSPSRHDPRGLDSNRSVRARFRLLEGKALRPGADETSINSRARSAKLRALERLPDPSEPTLPAGSIA